MSEVKRNNSIDGFRAIVHVSLVALHCAMLMSGHLASTGGLWNSVKTNYAYTFFQAGGIQVDLMFTLSAYLLVDGILNKKHTESLISFAIRRAFRMLPCILVAAVIGIILGDTWDRPLVEGEFSLSQKLLAMSAFIMNYFPAEKMGSFTLSLCWSCCVDLHAGVAIMALFSIFCGKEITGVDAAYRMRWIFFLLIVVSIVIRGYLFEKDSLNIFLLGQNSHFGLLMSDNSRVWMEETYGRK